MFHFYPHKNNICLGQRKTGTKTTIPELSVLSELQDCIITTDATETQTAIAEKIIEKEADYIVAIKDNQKTLWEENVITSPSIIWEATPVRVPPASVDIATPVISGDNNTSGMAVILSDLFFLTCAKTILSCPGIGM
ncbi:Transposase [Bacteroidales bacterium Barb6XT]|nr:Transposase [Bacteroidales bacterium Barb6XT]